MMSADTNSTSLESVSYFFFKASFFWTAPDISSRHFWHLWGLPSFLDSEEAAVEVRPEVKRSEIMTFIIVWTFEGKRIEHLRCNWRLTNSWTHCTINPFPLFPEITPCNANRMERWPNEWLQKTSAGLGFSYLRRHLIVWASNPIILRSHIDQ